MSDHRREVPLKFGPEPVVTINAMKRYLELVERAPVFRQLTYLEQIRTTVKVREIVYRGRQLSVRECAIFVKAAAKVVGGKSRTSSPPVHWGSYIFLESRNAIAVVNHNHCVVTIIEPNDYQLQHLYRMHAPAEVSGVRIRSDVQAMLPERSAKDGTEFEICIGDGTSPSQTALHAWTKNHDSDAAAVWMDAPNASAYTCKYRVRHLPALGGPISNPNLNAIWLMRELVDSDVIVPRRVVCRPEWAMFMLLSLIGRDAMVPPEAVGFEPGMVYALSLSGDRPQLERVYRI